MASDQEPSNGNDAPAPAPQGRMFSKEEVDRKLQGQGKQLKEYEAKLAALESALAERTAADEDAKRKRMAEEGRLSEVLAQREKELEEARTSNKKFQEAEAARVQRVAEANEARAKALPDIFRDMVPEGLDPDALAAYLPKLEKLAAEARPGGNFGGSPRTSGDDKATELEKLESRIKDKLNPNKKGR